MSESNKTQARRLGLGLLVIVLLLSLGGLWRWKAKGGMGKSSAQGVPMMGCGGSASVGVSKKKLVTDKLGASTTNIGKSTTYYYWRCYMTCNGTTMPIFICAESEEKGGLQTAISVCQTKSNDANCRYERVEATTALCTNTGNTKTKISGENSTISVSPTKTLTTLSPTKSGASGTTEGGAVAPVAKKNLITVHGYGNKVTEIVGTATCVYGRVVTADTSIHLGGKGNTITANAICKVQNVASTQATSAAEDPGNKGKAQGKQGRGPEVTGSAFCEHKYKHVANPPSYWTIRCQF